MAEHSQSELFRWTLCVPWALAEEARGFLLTHSVSGWEEEEHEECVHFRLHLGSEDEALELGREAGGLWPEAAVTVDTVPNEDWTSSWREFFTPVLVGERFAVIPPWMAEDHPFADRRVLVIEPATAFGTGHHATTAMCLEALDELHRAGSIRAGQRFLDLGTGTGILGIGLTRLGLTGLGVDIDPLAVQNCAVNKALNAVGDEFQVHECSVDGVGEGAFGCVVANILAGPLRDMAPDIAALLAPGAVLVLSGILATQADEVRDAYTELGLGEARRLHQEEWTALVFTAPESGA